MNPLQRILEQGLFGKKSGAVTPSDSTDLPGGPVKAIVLVTDGNVSFLPPGNANNEPVSFTGMLAGFVPPFHVRRVLATGTTATVRTVDD
ncbi:MAG TPA: hypothetical protein VGN75_03555 [Kaistia sp.]|nr:hypothetical protein [Kaistia sp.]